jgi:hypothetical protein
MSADDPKHTLTPSYAYGQLVKSLTTASAHADPSVRARAAARLAQWEGVLTGMADGSLTVGARTPVRGVPAWATLEVAHGGFATGALRAEGPLLPHEAALAEAAGVAPTRAALNAYYLSDGGQQALGALLASGCFRVDVPEEGALLAVAWLLARGEVVRALDVLDAVDPFLDRLRFYPAPASRPVSTSPVVSLRTVAEVMADLDAVKARPQIEAMHEALRHWTPLYDQAVALFLETVVGELPSLAVDAAGALVRRADGCTVVQGAYPCQRYPDGWAARALALLDAYAALRARHRLTAKPDKPKENFPRLREYLARCARDPQGITGRDVGVLRRILAAYVTAHGAPDSARRQATRAAQARQLAEPSRKAECALVRARLAAHPRDEGVADLGPVCAPLSAAEAASLGVAEGRVLPPSLVTKVERCLEAPLDVLVARGIVASADVLADLLPKVTAQVAVADFADPAVQRLYAAVYTAFRRRRSLLLLNLEHQVQLHELPWVAALEGARTGGGDRRRRAATALREVSALALGAFPEAIVPNKLVREMTALAATAGLALPLTEELAADIFMGAFARKFLDAAKVAARRLRGTRYARYYALPCEELLALDDTAEKWGVRTSPGFLALCEARAEAETAPEASARKAVSRWSPALNGTILEQSQILTTHNLAVLYEGCGLDVVLAGREAELALQCFDWVCKRLQMRPPNRHAQLIAQKNCAYAWRQMLFFLSVGDGAARATFDRESEAHFAEQPEAFRARFGPAMEGLRLVRDGRSFDARGRDPAGGTARRFLGWSRGAHWLQLGP